MCGKITTSGTLWGGATTPIDVVVNDVSVTDGYFKGAAAVAWAISVSQITTVW